MVRVPTHDSNEQLQPTPIDPKSASLVGNTVAEVGKGLEGIGAHIQQLDDDRQTLKAETYLEKVHQQNQVLAATDPNIDTLEKRIRENTQQGIDQASQMIGSPSARNKFVSEITLDSERKNTPTYSLITKRKIQDLRTELFNKNDSDFQDYMSLRDPQERELIKQRIIDRTNEAAQKGQINAEWTKHYLDTTLKDVDIKQVDNDMALDAKGTYQQLQKGKEGLYPAISEKVRKEKADIAQKLIQKQGSENKMIYGIAQNHAENQLIDALGNNQLTQEMISNSQIMGINGIKVRPEFAKAATEALQDPFPEMTSNDKYLKLMDIVTDPDIDPMKAKLDVLKSRGVTPQQKAHLLNAALREDPQEGKQSVDQLIQSGIQKNKQAILEGNRKMQKEVENKRSFLGSIGEMFADHAKDDAHLASMQQDFMANIQKAKSNEDMLNQAKSIINRDALRRNPKISNADPKGTVFQNKLTGEKKIFYPDGHSEPLKNGQ